MTIWDERRLRNSLRITLKELALLQNEANTFAEKLQAIEDESERGDAQRERGEQWAEVTEAIERARDEITDTLDALL
ncbi:MAG TPA: hypothetical protein VG276_06220 [Actinomycetes bacterium]|jgi:hypothetical protein|nr:hypothetical protein [Actinomycetes bacterium]